MAGRRNKAAKLAVEEQLDSQQTAQLRGLEGLETQPLEMLGQGMYSLV